MTQKSLSRPVVFVLAMSLSGAAAAAPTENAGSISVNLGMDWTNKYYFRGIVQETDGLTLQPYFNTRLTFYQSEERALSSVALTIGLWNSLHTGPSGTGAPDLGSETAGLQTADPKAWYESDLSAALSVGLLRVLSLALTYTAYMSPNKAFGTTHELAVGAGYDDSSLYSRVLGGRFGGLQPSVALAFELEGGAMGEPGSFIALGVSPAVTLLDAAAVALTAGVPVELGLGLGDYYDAPDAGSRDTFGYLTAGATVGVGLKLIPRRLGTWEVKGSAKVLVLGDVLQAANNDRRAELVAAAGLGIGY
jgi:hypothetical protein